MLHVCNSLPFCNITKLHFGNILHIASFCCIFATCRNFTSSLYFFMQFPIQCTSVDPQLFCGFSHTATALLQRFIDIPTLCQGDKFLQVSRQIHSMERTGFQNFLGISRRRRGRKNQLISRTDHKDTFHNISQFTDVSRPAMIQHRLDTDGSQRLMGVIILIQRIQEIFCQRNDVFLSFI